MRAGIRSNCVRWRIQTWSRCARRLAAVERMSTISYRWKSGDTNRTLDMVHVEGTNGRPFPFGEGEEGRPIDVRDFWIATVLVTQALWAHVMGGEESPAVSRRSQLPLENVS